MCRHCHARRGEVKLGYARLSLCLDCFVRFVERKVERTIKKYGMLKPGDRVLLALSGGKDSAVLLHILLKVMPDVEVKCLHIDLGVRGFSNECRAKAEEVAELEGVELHVVELEDFLGLGVEELAKRVKRVCSTCGLLRRYILNYEGLRLGVNKLATGHNLDDVTAILWDLYVRGDLLEAVKLQPVTPQVHPKALPRIKPLIELTDYELKVYADAEHIPYTPLQCTLGRESKLNRRKALLNSIEEQYPAFKHLLLKSHLKRITPLISKLRVEEEWSVCSMCGMPSRGDVCAVCRLRSRLGLIRQP